MRLHFLFPLSAGFAFGAAAFAGQTSHDNHPAVVSPLDECWRFSLAMSGWLAGMKGETGVNGLVSHVEVDPGDFIRRVDMAVSMRAEASKARFGAMSFT